MGMAAFVSGLSLRTWWHLSADFAIIFAVIAREWVSLG